MRRILIIAALLLATGALLVLFTPLRRFAKVCWLRASDWLAGEPARRLSGADLVVFDAADPGDRDGLTGSYGDVQVRHAGEAVVLSAAARREKHEICTRRLPRDWSRHPVLRLELAAVSGGPSRCGEKEPLPLLLQLRLRARPAWRITSWYRHRVFLPPGARNHEISLAPAGQLIDPANVRQLCLDLAPSGTLALRRVVLARGWRSRPGLRPGEYSRLAVGIIGDSTKLRRFDGLPPGAEARSVDLLAARGETVAFQVVLRRARRGAPRARVTLDPFVGPGGGPSIAPRLFEARTLVVRERSSAMFGPGSPGPGTYPDPLVPLGPPGASAEVALWHGNRLVWIDLPVPAELPPGRYRSRLRVEPGAVEREVSLEVLPVRLPAASSLFMIYYSPNIIRRTLGIKGAAFEELERAYHRLVHAHGAYLATDPVELEDLERLLPVLRGELFADGQGPPYWPVDLEPHRSDRERFQAAAAATVRWFRRHRLRTRPFVYLADEPASREDYERVRRLARWVHEAPAPGNELPVMVTEQVEPEEPGWPSLIGSVDYWVSSLNFPHPALERRKTTRERFFTYNGLEPEAGSMMIDAPGVSPRTWAWIAHRFDIPMWFYWNGTYYYDKHNGGTPRPLDVVYTDPLTFDQRRKGKDCAFGNGDGVVVYPPLAPGAPPVASMRLKALRRGAQDRRLLLLAESCGRRALVRELSRKLLPRTMNESRGCRTSWPTEEKPWENARRRLLRALVGCR
jgi:hypothetical protein